MKRTKLTFFALLFGCFWFSGCIIGPTTKEVRETMRPAGVEVNLRLSNDIVIGGELLTVSTSQIGVLTDQGVALVPSGLIVRLNTEQPRVIARVQGGPVYAEDVSKLRPVSRFPAGFPPGALDRLIELHGTHDVSEGGVSSS